MQFSCPVYRCVVAASSATDTCSAATITAAHADSTVGCVTTRDFTVTATDACLQATVAHVLYTWTNDTTGPSLTVPTTGLALGCNPVTLPDDSSVARSEERRVGKEGRSRSAAHAEKKNDGVTTRE